MAKAAKKTEEKTEAKASAPEFKYGVADLAEMLGIQEPSVRVQLRNRGIKRAGKSYGWNSKDELKEVADAIRSTGGKEAEKPAKAKPAKAEKADKTTKKKAA